MVTFDPGFRSFSKLKLGCWCPERWILWKGVTGLLRLFETDLPDQFGRNGGVVGEVAPNVDVQYADRERAGRAETQSRATCRDDAPLRQLTDDHVGEPAGRQVLAASSVMTDNGQAFPAPVRDNGLRVPLQLPIVITTGHDCQLVTLDGVDEAVDVVDASRPEAREILPEGLWFADAIEGMPHRVPDQGVDAL